MTTKQSNYPVPVYSVFFYFSSNREASNKESGFQSNFKGLCLQDNAILWISFELSQSILSLSCRDNAKNALSQLYCG
jgi:hypothetical protein